MASLFIRTDTQSPPLFLLARLGCSIGPIAPAAQECRRPADLCPNPCDERGAGNTRAGESCVGTARKNVSLRGHQRCGVLMTLRSRSHLSSSSEERRVGKECVSPCSSRWSQYQSRQKDEECKDMGVYIKKQKKKTKLK